MAKVDHGFDHVAEVELAVEAGFEGLVVSNHRGHELDTAPASIEMLPELVDAVAGRAEVLVYGGFRRGSDAVKALSLDASGCLAGRPWLSALAAAGEFGITATPEQFRKEIVRTTQLVGAPGVEALGRGNLPRQRVGASSVNERLTQVHAEGKARHVRST